MMIKLRDLLNEIKVNSPMSVEFNSPNSATIKMKGLMIPIEKRGDEWHLYFDAAGDEIYNAFGVDIPGSDDYYPEDESAELAPILISALKMLDPQIEKDDYDVTYLVIPDENLRGRGTKNFPEYKGNGVFTYKGKSIRYERAEELDAGALRNKYKIYDSEDNLLKIIESPNKDFESFMSFLSSTKPWGKNKYFPMQVIEELP